MQRSVWAKEDKIMMGNAQRQLAWTWAPRSLGTLDQRLGTLHGTKVGPLHVCDSCAAWPFRVARDSGTRMYPWCLSCLSGAHSLWWYDFFSLDTGAKGWVNFNLRFQGLLTLHGRPCSFWGVDGGRVSVEVGRGAGRRDGSGNCGWYVKQLKN